MSFKILLLPPDVDASWPEKIRQAVPGVAAKAFSDPQDALTDIADADAAYGTVPPELFARAKQLRWICAARAGLGGDWFYDALVQSNVVVTNMRGSYNEHLSTHAVTFLLAFARRFDYYLPQKRWQRGPTMLHLPDTTVLIVGVGGSGSEASKQCATFGMRVLGCDPRTTAPAPGMAELFTPDTLPDRIGEADFVLVTVPESPGTVGMFNAALFACMKPGAYFINISRGGVVVTEAGAGLDVVAPEPLPPESPLWSMPNVLITPHVAIYGAPYHQKWEEILLENCRRFAAGAPLLNVVDKEKWF